MLTTLNFAHLPLFNKQNVTVHHLVAALFNSYSAPHAIFLNFKNKSIPVWTGKIQNNNPFGGNNEPGSQSRQVPVWKGLISIVTSVIL